MDEFEEGKRKKRSTRYSGDFQVTFGDAASTDDEKDLKKKGGSSSKPKKSKECPGCGAVLPLASRECRLCDYQFTSKSMTTTPQAQVAEAAQVREKFLFEPERDEDGSLFIQMILGRRPRKSGRRVATSLNDMTAIDAKYDYEYLVKYKNLSYLHVQWLTANEIEGMGHKNKGVLHRYLTKLDKGDATVADDYDIDPSYTEVEKILDFREEEVHEVVDDLNPPSNNYIHSEPSADDQPGDADAKEEDAAGKEEGQNGNSGDSSNSDAAAVAMEIEALPSIEPSTAQAAAGTEDVVLLSNNSIFQPIERCRKVLEKIWDDPYALSFQEPVDTNVYEDYLEVVDEPMCLRDVKRKLESGEYSKYGQYNRFAADMRKIWRNCKLYNLYKSQIWHSANALSMMFERLYQAWVISFADALISFADPIGTPWEMSCRICLEEANDEQMMLCDHCDAAHHIYCLDPPLEKVPEDAWMCPRCIAWFAKTGAKVLSATVEEEARQQVDGAANRKVVKVKKKKYLVKWRGLSYRDCTWETAKDINDDAKIADYHQLNDSPPEEPPLTQTEIGLELAKDRKMQLYPAGINMGRENPIADLDAQIYAQIRSYHFLKWNKIIPDALLRESGPATYAYFLGTRSTMAVTKSALAAIQKALHWSDDTEAEAETEGMEVVKEEGFVEEKNEKEGGAEKEDEEDEDDQARPKFDKSLTWYLPPQVAVTDETDREEVEVEKEEDSLDYTKSAVAEILSEAIYSVARDHEKVPIPPYPSRPPLSTRYQIPSEIEICVPKGPRSLFMKVGCFQNKVVVAGFKPADERTGKKGPVEATGRIKIGDLLIAINGLYVHDLKFPKVLALLNRNQPFLYLRFLRIPACLEARRSGSVTDFLDRKGGFESFKLYPIRSLYRGVYPHRLKQDVVQQDGAVATEGEPMEEVKNSSESSATKKDDTKKSKSIFPYDAGKVTWVAEYVKDFQLVRIGEFESELEAAKSYDAAKKVLFNGSSNNISAELNFKSDGTLNTDAKALYNTVLRERQYNDSMNDTMVDLPPVPEMLKENVEDLDDFRSQDSRDSNSFVNGLPVDSDSSSSSESDLDAEDDDDDDKDSDDNKSNNDNDWDSTNEDVDWMPNRDKDNLDSDGPISRLLRAVNESDFAPLKSDWTKYIIELGVAKETTVVRVKKVEQIDLATGEVIRLWDSANLAARTLNIPPADIQAAISSTDGDNVVSGFKWQQVIIESDEPVDADDEDNLEDLEAAEESWKSKLPTKSQEYKNGGTLRDYQVEGLSWLLRCWYTKRSSILADEMGLGKTVQVVTFLDHLFTVESIRGPFLICVPLSTIAHWKREFEGWTNMICCIYHDVGGGRDMRDVIREYEWYYKGRSRRVLKFHVLITTYDDLTRDYEELAEIPWRVVIVDEAHRLRNVNSKLLECMRSVVTKGQIAYGYQHRILMTGTPLQNNTVELWSLLNFIEPAKFPDLEKFQERFGHIQTQEQVENLQRRIAPHLLRRVKEDVAKDIPPKAETIIDVELTTMQKQYYRAIFERNHGFLMQNLKGNLPKLMNIQMELRKCCNHPFLIQGVEQMEMDNLDRLIEEAKAGQKSMGNNGSNLSAKQSMLIERKEYDRRRMEEFVIPASGKLVLLDKLLPKLQKEGHKVLIFSQMVKMIDIIDEYCEMRKYPCERLDGRVSGNDRQKAIDRYHKDPNSFVFLLSTRAGGVGINLTAADTVIIFDSDWNPQNDIQAMARCHRIGQSKNVTIYRLITRRSFESEMFQRASKKLGLEQAVLGTRNFNDADIDENAKNNAKVDAKEMEQLLREGAYAVLLEDDTDAVKEFYEQDIDKILEQRSHVIVTESGSGQNKGTESWLNKRKKTGRTSKSMFTGESAKEHAEIDVNDPDFWKKVLPDLVTPDLMLERVKEVDNAANDDEDVRSEIIEKFMKDLSQMMDGMLDLNRRNQLPERERAVCMKLLLRITLKTDSFEEEDRFKAQEWLSFMEGTRVRRSRQDVYSGENFKAGLKANPKAKKLRGRAAAMAKLQQQLLLQQQGSKSRRKGKGDDDEDADEEDGDDDADEGSSGDDKDKTPKKKSASSRQLKKQLQAQLLQLAKKQAAANSSGKRKYTFKNREPAKKAAETGKRKYTKKGSTATSNADGDKDVGGDEGDEEGEGDDEEQEEGEAKAKRQKTSKGSKKMVIDDQEGDEEDGEEDEGDEDGDGDDEEDRDGENGNEDDINPSSKKASKSKAKVVKKIQFAEGVEGKAEPAAPKKRGRKPAIVQVDQPSKKSSENLEIESAKVDEEAGEVSKGTATPTSDDNAQMEVDNQKLNPQNEAIETATGDGEGNDDISVDQDLEGFSEGGEQYV